MRSRVQVSDPLRNVKGLKRVYYETLFRPFVCIYPFILP
nr:MAG TPA: hypothetical protein [Caudoviricetes sp.]